MDQEQGSGRRTDPSTRPDATRGERHGTPGNNRGAMTKRTHQPVEQALLFLEVSRMLQGLTIEQLNTHGAARPCMALGAG